MRLIDANALERVLQKRSDELMEEKQAMMSGAVMGAICYVINAPTVDAEPVVHGEWAYSRTQSEFAVSKCSNCGKEQFSISHVVAEGNYCPNCGAKMEVEHDN